MQHLLLILLPSYKVLQFLVHTQTWHSVTQGVWLQDAVAPCYYQNPVLTSNEEQTQSFYVELRS